MRRGEGHRGDPGRISVARPDDGRAVAELDRRPRACPRAASTVADRATDWPLTAAVSVVAVATRATSTTCASESRAGVRRGDGRHEGRDVAVVPGCHGPGSGQRRGATGQRAVVPRRVAAFAELDRARGRAGSGDRGGQGDRAPVDGGLERGRGRPLGGGGLELRRARGRVRGAARHERRDVAVGARARRRTARARPTRWLSGTVPTTVLPSRNSTLPARAAGRGVTLPVRVTTWPSTLVERSVVVGVATTVAVWLGETEPACSVGSVGVKVAV